MSCVCCSLRRSPISFRAAFLLALNAFIFLVANFYGSDEATLRLMLVFLPWVSLVLVPALSMAAWTDSHSSREIELLYSLPVSPTAVVLGKFLAGWLLLLLTLLMTLPFVVTLTYLGEPDKGVILAGYLAAALFLGASFAVALFAGTFVREPVGAFVTGAGALFCPDALWLGCIRQARERLVAPVGVGISGGLQPFKMESGVGPRTDSDPGADLFSTYRWWVVADGPLGHGGAPPWWTQRVTAARSGLGHLRS